MSAIISKHNYDPARLLDKVQVLIVNQSAEVAKLLKNILAAMGLNQSYQTKDAVEAIRYLREVRISIVITDSELKITQPDYEAKSQSVRTLSGAEFVRSIRQSPTSPSPYVAVVILAQEMDEAEIIKARDCGVNGVVLRPLEAHQLCISIRDIIASPRKFIVAQTFKGPCRRTKQAPLTAAERRKHDIHIVRNNG